MNEKKNPYPELNPFVQESSVVEFTQETRLGDGKRGIPHLASAAGHVAEVIVPLLTQYGGTPRQRNGFLELQSTTCLSLMAKV